MCTRVLIIKKCVCVFYNKLNNNNNRNRFVWGCFCLCVCVGFVCVLSARVGMTARGGNVCSLFLLLFTCVFKCTSVKVRIQKWEKVLGTRDLEEKGTFFVVCYSLLLVLGASLRDFDLGREIAPNVVVGGLVRRGTAVEQGTVRRAIAVHRAVLPVVAVTVGGSIGGRAVGRRHAAVARGRSVAVQQGEGGGRGRSFPLIAGGLGASLVRFVRVLVELVEQEEEHDGVHSDPPDERLRVVAVDEEQLERVHHDGDKLDHLQGGEVLLPPEVLLELGSEGGEQVVRVHHDVDEGVEQTEEGAVATGSELDAEPHGHGHASVVNDVQR